MTPVADFVQQFPCGGEPPPRTTRWVFDDDTASKLRCLDSRPIRWSPTKCGATIRISKNDNVIISLDTFYDRRSAFFF